MKKLLMPELAHGLLKGHAHQRLSKGDFAFQNIHLLTGLMIILQKLYLKIFPAMDIQALGFGNQQFDALTFSPIPVCGNQHHYPITPSFETNKTPIAPIPFNQMSKIPAWTQNPDY